MRRHRAVRSADTPRHVRFPSPARRRPRSGTLEVSLRSLIVSSRHSMERDLPIIPHRKRTSRAIPSWRRVMIETKTQKNIHRVVASAIALGIFGVGLNILVMQTLGSFDAGSVILALYLGFWAFVLGGTVLLFSSIWLFVKDRVTSPDPASAIPQANAIGLHSVGHRKMCPMH